MDSGAQMWLTIGAILTPIGIGFGLWLQAKATAVKVQAAVVAAELAQKKADKSHEVVNEIKEVVVKTELQTNSQLSELDRKVADHEKRCLESQRLIAELKLLLAEALRSKETK